MICLWEYAVLALSLKSYFACRPKQIRCGLICGGNHGLMFHMACGKVQMGSLITFYKKKMARKLLSGYFNFLLLNVEIL